MRSVLTAVALCIIISASTAKGEAGGYFWVEARINGKAARLVLDTGNDGSMWLSKSCADRAGLKLRRHGPQTFTTLRTWKTGFCTVELAGWSFWQFPRFVSGVDVLELPAFPERMDGVVGWPAVRRGITQFDAASQSFQLLRRMPVIDASWTKAALRPKCRLLILELPCSSCRDGKESFLVDTGAGDMGVCLSTGKWLEWKAAHTNLPVTLRSDLTVHGSLVAEQSWADRFAIGNLALTGVLVQLGARTDVDGTMGTAALRRIALIVDGEHGFAYLRPKTTPALPPHDRLGAVFVARDLAATERVAHVSGGGPAVEAGLRHGDVLLEVGGRDVTKWPANADAAWELHKLLDGPVGSRLVLTVRRAQGIVKITVVLRDIFGPN